MFTLTERIEPAILSLVARANLSEDWTCKVAETPEQVKELIGAGFDFVMQKDNVAYFRKRK